MTEPVDALALRKAFVDMNMPGVVGLIDMVEDSKRQNKELLEIGSSSIGEKIYVSMAFIYKCTAVRFPDEPFSFFYLGRRASRDGKRPRLTLFQHLDMLRQVLEQDVPPEPRGHFDLFCGVFADSSTRLAAGDVEGTDREGHYRIPKDEWNKAQQDPSFTPTKIRTNSLSIDP